MGAPTNPLVASQSESAPNKPFIWVSPLAQTAKNLPAMWETQVRSLGWEDLDKGMATHSSILAWRIPWTEEPGRLQSMGCKESDTTEGLTCSFSRVLSTQTGLPVSSLSSNAPVPPRQGASLTLSVYGDLCFLKLRVFYCFIWHLFSLWRFIYFYPYCLILNCVLVLVFLLLCKSSSPTRLQCCWV